MKVYVAGRLRQVNDVRRAQQTLKAFGAEITYDWTAEEIASDWHTNRAEGARLAAKEIRGVQQAEALVLVGHCGKRTGAGLGIFVEVGIALAESKPICIIGPERESVFWQTPYVFRVETIDGAVSELGLRP